MKMNVSGFAMIVALGSAGTAWAQEPEAAEMTDEAAVDAAPSEEAPPVEEPAATTEEAGAAPPVSSSPTSAAGDDAVRFRFGISGGGGMLLANGSTFPYGGGDLRFGVQINDLVGIVAQPQIGYYGADGATVGGGLVGVSTIADFTFVDRFFVGGGFGYAVLNSPSGPEIHLRVGGYPVVGRSSEKVRRKGLSLAVDLRFYFVNGFTFTTPTFNIGYEAF